MGVSLWIPWFGIQHIRVHLHYYLESSETQAIGMEDSAAQSSVNPSERIKNYVRRNSNHHAWRQTQSWSKQKSSTRCRQCGLSWPHTTPSPLQVKDMQQVWQAELFEIRQMCLTGQRTTPAGQSGPRRRAPNRSAQVGEQESSRVMMSTLLFTLGHEPGEMRVHVPEADVDTEGVKMKMMIDTGASTDI